MTSTHYVVTAIYRDFSSDINDNNWEISGDELPGKFLTFKFHANGNSPKNAGYVSVIFSNPPSCVSPFYNYDVNHLHVSVVDVEGNYRFTQSVVVDFDQLNCMKEILTKFSLERYLKRETLLSNPAELLPEDCLTICVDVDQYRHFDIQEVASVFSQFMASIPGVETETYIELDTDFGRELRRVSEVFRRASDVPMMESRTRKMHIPQEEMISLRKIFHILNGSEVVSVTIPNFCDLYRVADKYDIQPVIETCRQFVKAFLCATDDLNFRYHETEIVQDIFHLADDFRDDDLRETVEAYLESNRYFGINYYALCNHLKEILQTQWKSEFHCVCGTPKRNCVPRENSSYADCFFTMRRRVIKPEFQFYR